jgi:serine/threonine protein kinase
VCSSRQQLNPELLLLALKKEVDGKGTMELDPSAELRFGHYQVLQHDDGRPYELGRGSMGITYRGFDVDLHRPVTLKVINTRYLNDESARTRFVREARAAAAVRHPNVATVFHLGKKGDNYFYAMEFVLGETLEQALREAGPLDLKTALDITSQIAAGLSAIHKQELVHRDIKPSNIMVHLESAKLESVKIIDLGLAKPVHEAGEAVSVQGAFAGTPQYASPEQFSGLGADIRSDLYSLGITLWEMISGDVPFKGSSSGLFYQHQHARLPLAKLTLLPQPAVALLEILLEKDPAKRFQTPDDLIPAIAGVKAAVASGYRLSKEKLKSTIQGEIELHPNASGSTVKPWTRSRRLALYAAGALFIAGSALGLFYYEQTKVSRKTHADKSPQLERSIAVLPFESISANKDDAYFADGVQDEILNRLAKIAQLKVISRTSVMQYPAGTRRDLRQIANALGVASVLEGTVRRDANRVRVSTELIDAHNDNTVWADSFERDLTDIFAIQSEIAQTIATKLNATLSPDEERSISTKATDSVKAYSLYLKAKVIIDKAVVDWDTDPLEKPLHEALDFLDEAVQLDPNFALAYCAFTVAHDFLYLLYDHTSERRALADAAVNKAMRLGRDLPEVHFTYAKHLFWAYGDYEAARAQLAIARSGLPNDTRINALEAKIDQTGGKFERSVQEFNEALLRDPLNESLLSSLALSYGYMRQYRASEQMFDRLIKLAPDLPMIKVQKAFVVDFSERGDTSAVESALGLLPKSQANNREVLSLQLAIAIDREEWQRAKDLIARFDGGDDEGEFGYLGLPVPVGCYSILLAALQAEPATPEFAVTREEMNNRVKQSPDNGALLSLLALVDAFLGDKERANDEAARAAELLPVSKDASDGPEVLRNVAAVHVWTRRLEEAFSELASLASMPKGIAYGELKCDPYWAPIRKDPRYEKLLAELGPKE